MCINQETYLEMQFLPCKLRNKWLMFLGHTVIDAGMALLKQQLVLDSSSLHIEVNEQTSFGNFSAIAEVKNSLILHSSSDNL